MMIHSLCTSNLDHIEIAAHNQLQDLILLHPKWSMACTPTKHLAIDEIKYIYQTYPKIKLYLCCDILFHNKDFDRLGDYLTQIQNYLTGLQCQDIGLLVWIKEYFPTLDCWWNDTFLSMNSQSLSGILNLGATRISLSHQLSLTDITCIQEKFDSLTFDILVQGPFAIQYSKRTYMTAYQAKQAKAMVYSLENKELEGRYFRFVENSTGTVMFSHFDRCLIEQTLENLNGVIDARFYTKKELKNTLRAYCLKKSRVELQESLSQPQKPGFFIVNKTNNDWRDKKIELKRNKTVLGTIIAIEDTEMIIESISPIKPGSQVCLINPMGTHKNITLQHLFNMNKEPLNTTHSEYLIRTKKVRGACVQSLITET